MEDILGLLKFKYFRCLKFLIFLGDERLMLGQSLRMKNKKVPPHTHTDFSINSNLSLFNAYKWAFVLVGFCPSGLLS